VTFIIPSSPADVKVTRRGDLWTELEIVSVAGDPDEVRILDGHEPGAWCVPMTTNARVRCPVPVRPGDGSLDCKAYRDTGGILGAKVAVVHRRSMAPTPSRRRLKEVAAASDLWRNLRGGPFAQSPAESYLLAFYEPPCPANVQQWIEILGEARINWLDHGYGARWGDYEPWPEHYPRGVEDVVDTLETLKAAGIKSIFHCYSPSYLEGSSLLHFAEGKTWYGKFGLDGFLPTTDHGLFEIAGKIAAFADLGYDGICFDAMDWCREIQTPDEGWWWAMQLANGVGERLDIPNIQVETSWSKLWAWNFVSQRGSLDQGTKTLLELVDACIASFDVYPDWGLPQTMGWFRPEPSDSSDDIRYLLRVAAERGSAVSFRDLTPKRWAEHPKLRRFLRLIGGRDGS